MLMALPVVDADYLKEIDKARRDLRALIAYKNCAPIMLRLAWHDAGTYDKNTKTGGPNGSIRNEEEFTHGSNNGLKIAIDFCEEVKAKHPKITYADLYQLAGVVAVEVTGGPTVDFVPGRKDSKVSPKEGRLPDAKKDSFVMADLNQPSGGNGLENQNGHDGPIGTRPMIIGSGSSSFTGIGPNGNEFFGVGLTGSGSNSGLVMPNGSGTASGSHPMPIPERPEKFAGGANFKVWQQKMLFLLTSLQFHKFLTEDPPIVPEGVVNAAIQLALDGWNHMDYLCRNHILNGLSPQLYEVYFVERTAKELWESLDKKYRTEDAGAKKILVGQFLNYKMNDSKSVASQVQELQLLIHEMHAERMETSESFQVAAIIEKLPPRWNGYKNYLKHKRKEISVKDLIVRLRIEEENRKSERKFSIVASQSESRPNFVEVKRESKKGKNPAHSKMGPKGGISKKPKFNGKCYNCNKMGHKSSDCRFT